MSYRIEPTKLFEREAMRLSKKYRSLKSELTALSASLKEDPHRGADLGSGLFKLRLAIRSKNKGKSGGGRVVIYVIDEDQVVHLLTLYDKSEFDTISTESLRELAREFVNR